MTMPETGGKASSILRLRAGFLLLAALVLLCVSGGTFVARQFQLGTLWGLLIALVLALAVGLAIYHLTNKSYWAIAALVTLVTTYLAYDFLRNAVDWSRGTSLTLAAIPLVVLLAAFWDFRRLKGEIRAWANRR
ncbi:hypothetical protein [Azorhizobium doebereinerae]|uniref:hypothetical protein n=1 Tax=Azorhizobium doebereinerae TaxID=281091 RepID=UPI00041E7C4C|nr:hypothetical protein [Azorhizobium doebereinerae]